MTRDVTGLIEIEQLIRWKDDFPQYFENNPKIQTVPRSKYPRMCGATENFIEYLEKYDRFVRRYYQLQLGGNRANFYVKKDKNAPYDMVHIPVIAA